MPSSCKLMICPALGDFKGMHQVVELCAKQTAQKVPVLVISRKNEHVRSRPQPHLDSLLEGEAQGGQFCGVVSKRPIRVFQRNSIAQECSRQLQDTNG